MNQSQTPLFDALVNFNKKNKVSYHVPGHKNGQVFMEKGRFLYESLLTIDATELSGLDDLHAPEGPIMEAELLLANLHKVQKSYFLVNGSTVGNLAMILATCGDGDTVLVQRNCHKSILNGLMLVNANPVFLTPTLYADWGIPGGVNDETVFTALDLYPETKAIILTYPNYYGFAEDLSTIIELAHIKRIPVLVDEAHGAHLSVGAPFPRSAIRLGADIVVHSAHKTLPAMTMGSYLHVNSSLLGTERIQFYLQMLQSSSPSYPIMGSLDLARAYLATFTDEDRDGLVKAISEFKFQLSRILEIDVLEPPVGVLVDPLKVSIKSRCGLSGYELQALLEEVGVYTELADPQNVLFVLPLVKRKHAYPFLQTVDKIETAVKDKVGKNVFPAKNQWKESSLITSLALSYSQMKQSNMKQVPFNEAVGRVSTEMVIPYPPGVPLIMSGEMITAEKLARLESLLAHRSRFHGGSVLAGGKLMIYEKE